MRKLIAAAAGGVLLVGVVAASGVASPARAAESPSPSVSVTPTTTAPTSSTTSSTSTSSSTTTPATSTTSTTSSSVTPTQCVLVRGALVPICASNSRGWYIDANGHPAFLPKGPHALGGVDGDYPHMWFKGDRIDPK